MSIERKIKQRTQRRAARVRYSIAKSGKPRVSVFRSLKNFSAQIIDDAQGKTLAACSTLEMDGLEGDKKAKAFAKYQTRRL